ncbi:MAG: aminoacyl-tRNA hydrolase [Bacteroidetes bacterium 4572_128]|nr:MAG: aminoacyl-tRNA hydrolase [Bacteroidetes bacterium 4572_128]
MKYLIVGLGNIGESYKNTRHNIGFKILDAWSKASNLDFTLSRYAYFLETKFKGRALIFIKPTTYVNLSGKAVSYWLQKKKIPVENLLVISDDLNLQLGKLKLKLKGGDGGHNGLKNIEEFLGSKKYSRLKFGIGHKFNKGEQRNYVLGEWTQEENIEINKKILESIEIIKSFTSIGTERTMNFFNKKKLKF